MKFDFSRLYYSSNPKEAHLTSLGPLLALVWVSSHGGRSVLEVIAWVFVGVFYWTIIEYFLHRFIFHARYQSQLGKRFADFAHIKHHRNPNDPRLVIAGPVLSLPLACVWGVLAWLLLQNGVLAANVMVGVFVGYNIYEWIHYNAHQPGRMEWGFLKVIKRHHLLHHFQDWNRNFGVSSPLWDWVLRSGIPKRAQREL